MSYEVEQKSKSRWIVKKDGEQKSKHASKADAERAAKNYAAQDVEDILNDFNWVGSRHHY